MVWGQCANYVGFLYDFSKKLFKLFFLQKVLNMKQRQHVHIDHAKIFALGIVAMQAFLKTFLEGLRPLLRSGIPSYFTDPRGFAAEYRFICRPLRICGLCCAAENLFIL